MLKLHERQSRWSFSHSTLEFRDNFRAIFASFQTGFWLGYFKYIIWIWWVSSECFSKKSVRLKVFDITTVTYSLNSKKVENRCRSTRCHHLNFGPQFLEAPMKLLLLDHSCRNISWKHELWTHQIKNIFYIKMPLRKVTISFCFFFQITIFFKLRH